MLKGDSGPTAVETRLGWVLSGPTEVLQEDTTINFTSAHSSHVLRVDSVTELVVLAIIACMISYCGSVSGHVHTVV